MKKTLFLLIGIFISCSIHSQQYEDDYIIASDGVTNDLFGIEVEYEEDFIVVGALFGPGNHHNSGAVYIYEPNGTGWDETKIFASDGADGDRFGLDLDVNAAKDRIVVGAGYDNGVGVDSGSIYVYDWNGTTWVETKIVAFDESTDFKFGQAVAINDVGDRIVVGSWSDTTNGAYSGSMYILDWDGTDWIQTKILPSDGGTNYFFGVFVDVSGDRILSSAWGNNSLYLYDWNGTSWVETKFNDPTGGGNGFAQSVSIEDDRFVVGCYLDDDQGADAGAVFIYDWNGTTWIETKMYASDTDAGDFFGKEVDYQNDVIISGAERDDVVGPLVGSVYRFDYNGTNWNEVKYLPSDGEDFDNFGTGVSSKGDITVVGCSDDQENGSDSGSIYIFESTAPLLTWYEDSDGDGFGNALVSMTAASQPAGYVATDTDCNDTDPLEFPGQRWFIDVDGDGYSPGGFLTQCLRPTNFYDDTELIDIVGDCDDNDPLEFPGQIWWKDSDTDGYSDGSFETQCQRPNNHFVAGELMQTMGDCNDANPSINPGVTESCDGVDNDCNNVVDDGCFACDGLNITIPILLQDSYRAEELLDSDATINQTNPVLFTAGDELTLEPGFTVDLGTDFVARIETCIP